jgi:hypothetical protein
MRNFTRTAWVVAVGIAISLSSLSAGLWLARRPPCSCAAMDDWKLEDLPWQLRRNGMELRAVSAPPNNPLWVGAYLTTTNKSREQLLLLPALRERIADWNGTVYYRKSISGDAGDAPDPNAGDCSMRVGPFLLFGDRELMARIRDTLRQAGFDTH